MNQQASLPSGKPKTWKARYTVLSLIWLAWLLSFLDRMVMSVSLPYIGKDLNLDTTQQGLIIREGANKQVISSQADSLIKISRIWADFFPANTSNQPI